MSGAGRPSRTSGAGRPLSKPFRPLIERATDEDAPAIRALLVDLAELEQERYEHPRLPRSSLEATTDAPAPTFTGENWVFVARESADSEPLGLCWVVLYDPGTGLEAEIAEVVVAPHARGRGIASALLAEARALLRRRRVTFACVWTRDDNPAAMAAYRSAGFLPTEQTVLTWLPLPGR